MLRENCEILQQECTDMGIRATVIDHPFGPTFYPRAGYVLNIEIGPNVFITVDRCRDAKKLIARIKDNKERGERDNGKQREENTFG